jgi:uncharacterized protein YdiU (UPF0061 family)
MDRYRPAPTFSALGPDFADPVRPAAFPQHVLRFRNQRWAHRVGLGELTEAEWVDHFARFVPLPGNLKEPLAMRYHGHQFQSYNPELGDGRGFLFAQLHDPVDGRLLDLGTKGSGQTPYSRGGDGRLTLKGGVREVLATELLETLGVYTSKTFSLIETGQPLFRGDEPSPTRSSVLVRLSHGHVRFGTFQRHAYEGAKGRILALVEHAAQHYLPEAQEETQEDLPRRVLRAVVARSAALAAQWMVAGFVHGVLNTDNMNITGESFDYGPYRFLPQYDPTFTAAYFDHSGLYCYGQQPHAVLWNLHRLADALSVAAGTEGLGAILEGFRPAFSAAFIPAFLARLGVKSAGEGEDGDLVEAALRFLEASRAPYDPFFHHFYGGPERRAFALASPSAPHYQGPAFDAFIDALAPFAPAHPARAGDPYFARPSPVTLIIEELEAVWAPIAEADDWSAFEAKLAELALRRRAYGVSP